jgi:hypothetical protein
MTELLLDAAGRRRSPATLPGFHAGRPPRNKGVRYPADPPTVEEIVAVMRAAGERAHGHRLRGLIVALWRAGLRIRSTGTHRGRPGPTPWLAARPPRQGRQTTRGRHGRMGLGTAPALGRRSHRATHWPAVLRHERHNTRTTVVKRRRARRAAPGRRACRRASTLCPARVAPRPRCSPRPVAPTGARVRAKAASLSLEQLGRSRAAAC